MSVKPVRNLSPRLAGVAVGVAAAVAGSAGMSIASHSGVDAHSGNAFVSAAAETNRGAWHRWTLPQESGRTTYLFGVWLGDRAGHSWGPQAAEPLESGNGAFARVQACSDAYDESTCVTTTWRGAAVARDKEQVASFEMAPDLSTATYRGTLVEQGTGESCDFVVVFSAFGDVWHSTNDDPWAPSGMAPAVPTSATLKRAASATVESDCWPELDNAAWGEIWRNARIADRPV